MRIDASALARFWIREWPAGYQGPDPARCPDAGSVLLDTCLRRLAFGVGAGPVTTSGTGWHGPAAYRRLLEVICGLESAVPGEANVLGQFRSAWEAGAAGLPEDARERLQPLVLALLADARTVRRDHLQGVAGSSYGSLARALLAPARGARLLFIGAGGLARSMVPLFGAYRVGLWTHRPAAPIGGIDRWFAPGEMAAAAAWAGHVIFTTPPQPALDEPWRAHLAHYRTEAVLHLGHRQAAAGAWPGVGRCYTLDDVFALAGQRDRRRAVQLGRARTACAELARRRCAPAAGDPAAAWPLPALAGAWARA